MEYTNEEILERIEKVNDNKDKLHKLKKKPSKASKTPKKKTLKKKEPKKVLEVKIPFSIWFFKALRDGKIKKWQKKEIKLFFLHHGLNDYEDLESNYNKILDKY